MLNYSNTQLRISSEDEEQHDILIMASLGFTIKGMLANWSGTKPSLNSWKDVSSFHKRNYRKEEPAELKPFRFLGTGIDIAYYKIPT